MSSAKTLLKQVKDIPGPPLLSVLGNFMNSIFKEHRSSLHEKSMRLRKIYGDVVKEKRGFQERIHLFSQKDIAQVFASEDLFPRVPDHYQSCFIHNLNGESWQKLSSQARRTFGQVDLFLGDFNVIAQDFVSRIERRRYINDEVNGFNMEVQRWSCEVLAKLIFDVRLRAFEEDNTVIRIIQDHEEWVQLISKSESSLLPSLFLKRRINLQENMIRHRLKTLSDDAIMRVQEAIQNKVIQSNQFSFLTRLLCEPQLSLEDVEIIASSSFVKGLDLMTSSLLFNLYCLAKDKESQEKVFNEILSVGKDADNFSEDHLVRMPYLTAFFRETNRLFPLHWKISRITTKSIQLSEYEIPQLTNLELHTAAEYRNESLFRNPDQHIPERWLNPLKNNLIDPDLISPFGLGSRICICPRLAEFGIFVTLIHILRKFKLEYPVGEELSQITRASTLIPDRPVRIKFKTRVKPALKEQKKQ